MGTIRQAVEADILRIKRTAGQYSTELGFVNRAALQDAVKRGTLLFEERSGAFCHYRIRKRDQVCVIYEIAVPKLYLGQGIGKTFIMSLPRPIHLKCPVNNRSNKFYEHLGFHKVATVPGRKRELNVWVLS